VKAAAAKLDPTMLGLVGPFTKIARSMSENHRVQVIPDGFRVCTDGDRILIPFTSDFLSPERRVILEGMLDHEVCHVTEEREHRAAGRVTPVELMQREHNKTIKMLLNVFEDIRIEHKWSQRYPGVSENLRTMNEDFVARFRADPKYHKTFWHRLGSAIIMKARGFAYDWAGKEIEGYLDLIEGEVREATRTSWVQDSYDLAERVARKIREAAEDTLERDKKAKKKKKDPKAPKKDEKSKDPKPGEAGESDEDGGEESESEGSSGSPSSGGEDGEEADDEDDEAESKSKSKRPSKAKASDEDDADDDEGEEADDEADDEESDEEGGSESSGEADDEDGDEGEDEGAAESDDEADDEHEPSSARGASAGDEDDDEADDEASDDDEGDDGEDESGPLDEPDDDGGMPGKGGSEGKGESKPEDGEEPTKAEVSAASEALHSESEIEDFRTIMADEVEKMVRADAREHSRYVPDMAVRKLDRWFTPQKTLGMANYQAARDQVAGQIGALRGRQLAYIQTLTRKRIVSGLDRGRLDDTMLSEVRTGSRHVFAETVKGIDLDTAIEALIDLSGSMSDGDTSGCAAYYAKRTAIALAESWEPLRVPYEVIGFHNAHSRGAGWGRPRGGDPDTVHRAPFDFMIFKAWGERLAQCRERFTAIRGYEDNADGEAVYAAACRLAVRPEKRKILMVISDGYPAHAGVDMGKLNAHLKMVVKMITNAGIEVIGFGAGTDAPKQFYNKSTGASNVIVKDLNQLAATLFSVMRERLLRGKAA
jgi:cobalamin biosynthesis protein CobT